MTQPTITGMRGSPLPDLEVHGLGRKMREAKRLIDEQARLRKRANELGHERMRLQEEIKQGEREHTQAWGRALRAGEEVPTDERIEAAKRRLEEVVKERS